nr:MAG TPA: hypothetical protein [Caudoviricetes sp.]
MRGNQNPIHSVPLKGRKVKKNRGFCPDFTARSGY